MIIAKIRVNGAIAKTVYRKVIPAGIIGAQVEFDYDEDIWHELHKTVVFKGAVTKDVVTDANIVTIPHEVVEKPFFQLSIGVYGVNADGNIVIPTLWEDIGDILDATTPSGDTNTDPSLPVWAQIQAVIGNLDELETTARDNLVAAVNEVAQDAAQSATAAKNAQDAAEAAQRKAEDAYEMPADGIPEEDLSSELQSKINGLGSWVQMANVAYGIDSYNYIVNLKENLKKVCICAYDSRTYILNYLGADKAQFVSNFDGSIYYVECSNANVWSASSAPLSEAGTFVCRYGVTTLAQIQEAQRNGKLAVCEVGNVEYVLTSVSTTEAQFTSVSYDDEMLYSLTCNDDGWKSGSKSISTKDPIVENAKANGGIGWTVKQDIVNSRIDDRSAMNRFPTIDGASIKPNTSYIVYYQFMDTGEFGGAADVEGSSCVGRGTVTSDANGVITLPECYNAWWGHSFSSLGTVRNTLNAAGTSVSLGISEDYEETMWGSEQDYISLSITENVVHAIDEKFLPPELKEELALKADKSEIPTALPNPHKLTINGTEYDGSADVQMTIEGGGSTIALDTTMTQSGNAADAKAVGDALAGKQNTISDLEAIRTGAAKGATALQSVPNTYRTATEQDIIDNSKQDKATLEADVAAKGFTKNTGTYSKPAGGIPKADLASAVQTSLDKADSALQSVPSTYRTAAAQDVIDSGKVDKVTGKGLSTNDYTAAAKAKVDAIPTNPKYTDTVYDDTALKERVATIEGKESAWDAKSDFSGSYNDLTDKPTIPTEVTPLIGTTNDLTPKQVYDAVSVGIPVKVQFKNSLYGDLSFTAFNIAESLSMIVSQAIVYYGGVYILAELSGNIQAGNWFIQFTELAEKADIPTVPSALKNPNALTIKIGSTTVTYDGSTAQTVTIADGSEVSY